MKINDLVATYSVINVLLSLATLGGGRAERARPKSQSCEEEVSASSMCNTARTCLEVAVGIKEEV